MNKSEELIKNFSAGILPAYSQIFFSQNRILGILLLVVSFFDFFGGLFGLLSVLCTMIFAELFHLKQRSIADGTYGYNALLVGIGIGVSFSPSLATFFLTVLASMLTLLTVKFTAYYLGSRHLPMLSLPFLLVMWVVLAGTPNFAVLKVAHRESLHFSPEMMLFLQKTDMYLQYLPYENFFHLYFRSLGAVFFQYNDLAGIIIAVGILLHSRIQFLLSVFGFSVGYFFYTYFEGDFSQLIYSYIGFNFILTSVALGGFFLIPTVRVFALLLFLTPIIGLLVSAFHGIIFVKMGLPLYSLPFNVVMLFALAFLRMREKATSLLLTNWLCFSPEKNLYEHLLTQKISKKQYFIPISAPVKGEWRISQAFDGSVTHKGEWRFAWDFVKTDEQHRTSKNQPKKPNDFFCYDGEIFAPASGYVTDVKEGIEDNPLGKINAEENWGNALVIKHAEGLYSCIAHFKKGSLTAKIGDYVYAGQFLGVCGNSGYSYEPHVHFQLQALNYIGAPTIEYPLFMYRETNQAQIFAAEYGFPQLNSFVETAFPYPDFAAAFSFFAGSVFRWTKEKGGKTEELTWFVGGDAFNGWYLWCQNSSSFAYFHHDGFFVRFTKFFGDKKSELFDFFLLSQKILLRFAENVTCRESVNFYDYVPFYWLYLQDFTAFFWQFLSAEFVLRQREMNENERFFSFETKFSVRAFGNEISQKEAFFDIKEGFIDGFILSEQGKTMYSLKRKIK